jgi:hypothetical protein
MRKPLVFEDAFGDNVVFVSGRISVSVKVNSSKVVFLGKTEIEQLKKWLDENHPQDNEYKHVSF